jgi:hypothetical protein
MPTRLPLGSMIDEPSRYDTLETWEEFLAEFEPLPPSMNRNTSLSTAKEAVRTKQRDQTNARLR